MAGPGKLSQPAIAAAVSVALILLSVSTTGERQCTWCGPLADQVHRSQRAPPCDAPGDTTCDEGLTHCAIVASSPPYVESRLCVKLYQDECFSNFCNSTRTWRMTCPCRGDFCNKHKTEREYEAFAFLARLGSKIQNLRIKKRTVSLSKFISHNTNRTAIDNNEKYINDNTSDEVDKNLQADKSISNNDMTSETEMKDPDDNVPNINELNNKNEINKEDDNMTPVIMNDSDKNDEVEATTSPPNVVISSVTEIPVVTSQKDPIAVSAELSTMETPRKDINMDIANNMVHEAEMSATETSIEKNSMKTDIKPSMEMPTAEALQQNSSPSDITPKTQTTVEQTPETTVMMMTTKGNIQVTVTATPDPMKVKKNNSVKISFHNLLALFWILLFFM